MLHNRKKESTPSKNMLKYATYKEGLEKVMGIVYEDNNTCNQHATTTEARVRVAFW